MPSLSPALRAGATLAALLISGFLIRKVVSEYAKPAPSNRKPGQKLSESPGDVFLDGGFDGSSTPGPSEAGRKAAEAAEVRADQNISRRPTLRPRLRLTFARQEPEARKSRASGALGRLLRQQKRQTMNEIMRQAAKDETRQRGLAGQGELWS